MQINFNFKSLALLLIGFIIFYSFFLFFLHVDISLWFHSRQPVYFHNQTLNSFFEFPGRPSELISNYLGQYMETNYIGSVILTFLLFIFILAIYGIFYKILTFERNLLLIVLSVIPLLIAHGFYNYQFAITVSYVIAGVLSSFLILLIQNSKHLLTLFYYLVFTFAIYYFSGSAGIYLLISILLGYCIIERKYYRLAFILFPLALPWIFFYLSDNLLLKEAYWRNFMLHRYNFAPLIVKVLPLVVFIIVIVSYSLSRLNIRFRFWLGLFIQTIVLALIIGITFNISYHEKDKYLQIIDRNAYEEKWDEVLENANSINLQNEQIAQFEINRALYHKGLLLSNMFNYVQYFGVDGLMLDRIQTGVMSMPTSDLYYDLSSLNGSKVWANTAYVIFGTEPRILKRLVNCCLLIGENELASKYLSLLSLSSRNKAWAVNMGKYINCETCLENNPDFLFILKYKEIPDFFEEPSSPRTTLAYLSGDSNINRMALEYAIAYDMLDLKLGSFVKNIGKLRKIGYKTLPRSVQEAILLYLLKSRNFEIDLNGYKIDADIQNNFILFNKTMQNANGNKKIAQPSLNQFKNTYWYYVVYNSPISNGRELKSRTIESSFY